LYNKNMNDPNAPKEQQSNPKRSSRATNFLMSSGSMGSSVGQVSQTGPIQSENPQPQVEESPETNTPPQPENKPPRTGVISSTIYPAQRPGMQSQEQASAQSANKTSQLPGSPKSPDPNRQSKKLSIEEKARLQDQKIDNIAERITNVLKQLSDFKTGMLDTRLAPSQKLQFMADKYPGLAKFLGVLLTQLEPVIMLMQRINQKLVEKNLIQGRRSRPSKNSDYTDEMPEEQAPVPTPKVSFLELAEKNIVFCDNRKRPLYSLEQMRGKHGYTASEEVLIPMIMENIIQAFQEVAPKAKAIPTPQSGMYAGRPMDQVMNNISEDEIMLFLNYVQKFPRGYVGKNFRITESFAGWVVSGTPDD
jgi:hypothetical protein